MRKISIILFLIFVIACTPGGNGGTPNIVNFRTGSQGVYMGFVANQPPYRIYDDESVNVLIDVQNMGAYPVGNQLDKVFISGFDQKLIYPKDGAYLGQKIPYLEGKTADSPNAISKDYVEFKMGINPLTVTSYPFKMMAAACYGYKTVAETTLCIDPNPFSRGTRQKVCVSAGKSLGSQGGPVAVNSVQVEPRKGKTVLTINVANVGGGDVYKRDAINLCSPYSGGELSYNELGFVEVADVLVGDTSVKPCSGLVEGDYLRLQNGAGSFRCTVDTSLMSTEEARLMKIILDYGYRNIIFKDFELVHVP